MMSWIESRLSDEPAPAPRYQLTPEQEARVSKWVGDHRCRYPNQRKNVRLNLIEHAESIGESDYRAFYLRVIRNAIVVRNCTLVRDLARDLASAYFYDVESGKS